MKRAIGSLMLASTAAVLMAQAPFTIVRPADGSKVREQVHVLIPKGSIPEGGYIGVFLDGKFIEATAPSLQGKYYVYTLDTKGRKIADGHLKLELALYVDYKEQARVVERSSVEVNVANQANIPIPNAGIKLRYSFRPGTQWVYNLQQRVSMDTISEDQNKLGGKPAELPLDVEKIRLLYEVDNSYGDGSGLVRMQPLPTKGKDSAILTVHADQGPKRYMDTDMAPLYMRLTSTGHEVFGSAPSYFPMEGTTGEQSVLNLYAPFPLPTLPEKAVRPGDAWQSRFQDGKINLATIHEQTSFVSTFPCRGEFTDVEWESGHPCAKIENTIAAAELSNEDKKLLAQGSPFGGDKIQLKETVWFALDTRQIVKILRDETIETKVQTQTGMGGMGSGYPGGGPMGPGYGGGYPGGPMGGAPGGYGGGKGSMGAGDKSITGDTTLNQQRRRGGSYGGGPMGPAGMGGPMGRGGYPGGGPMGPAGMGYGGGMGGPNGRTGQPAVQNQYIRVHLEQIFTLEQ